MEILDMDNKPMKLHTQKGKRRLWLEEQKYGLPGFPCGSKFNVVYNEDSVEIKADPQGTNTVFTRVKAASKQIPTERRFSIVGIHNSRLKELFGDTENGVDTPVSYEMSEGYIKIMPVAS
jgi:hypothetical protein